MAGEVERIYTIPFREAYQRKRTARAIRAIDILKKFLARHMKADIENVHISKGLNELIWARGIQKPPRRVKALVKKDATGKVLASLVDENKQVEAKKEKRKEKQEKKKAERKKEHEKTKAESGKKPEAKPVEKPAAKAEAAEAKT